MSFYHILVTGKHLHTFLRVCVCIYDLFSFFYNRMKKVLQTLIVYIDPIMALRDTYPLLQKSFPLRKRKGSMSVKIFISSGNDIPFPLPQHWGRLEVRERSEVVCSNTDILRAGCDSTIAWWQELDQTWRLWENYCYVFHPFWKKK